jgi:hypothetical protein
MALPGESPVVILEGFGRLLSATLQVLGVARLNVCAMKVVGEDLPTIERVPR